MKVFERRQTLKRRRREQERCSSAASALIDLSKSADASKDKSSSQSNTADDDASTTAPLAGMVNSATQTNLTGDLIDSLKVENDNLRAEVRNIKETLNRCSLDTESFNGNDDKVKFFTGLPSFCVMMTVFNFILPFLSQNMKLSPFSQFIVTLLRLRLNLCVQYLAHRFDVSVATISRVTNNVINIMHSRLVPSLVIWPEREQLRLSLPMSFRSKFKQCACVIDCFEVFIERPSGLKARAQTYSTYKSHNTMKYLIGITPQGTISFISKGWGGRASDKFVTEHSGFLDHLLPGDLILADRGFDVEDAIGMCQAKLKIPAFTKGLKQLSPLDVEGTRGLASCRIHVERVIGLVRQKYTLLESVIPITLLISDGSGMTTLDKIVHVSCALTNLCEPIVPFE